jgi:hypothetical protein
MQLKTNLQSIASSNLYRDGRGGLSPEMVDQSGRDYARSAGEGLILNPSLIGTDGKRTWGQNLNEVGVRSGRGKPLVISEGPAVSDHWCRVQFGTKTTAWGTPVFRECTSRSAFSTLKE